MTMSPTPPLRLLRLGPPGGGFRPVGLIAIVSRSHEGPRAATLDGAGELADPVEVFQNARTMPTPV